ncbi:NADH dehydrogenase (ubiquinone) 30 kDa subunit [Desulfitobacterium hafniense DCB-2]|uniref:NADH dehydrogenase (Ubiquinone) 30 kDa subunit n=1 Tax=Desulfitobacterium hafniense (strain DSM 10664 / DCB-2) TaxID=272564 RepID=B8FUL9_DESHD|nr:NADH-quinone oxidoreductase subunit C [Desulfitobacterium hafniense]ACL22289.1 NADH dehydrogenase (ubiquinone) 30 kDa subunit [Desulfitobacterium hafniense DCB-2]
MESSASLRNYFEERVLKQPEDFSFGLWTKNEGLVWLKPACLPEVMEQLWLKVPSRPLLMTHVGNDERSLGHGFVIYLLLQFPGDFTLTLGARGIEKSFPSLTLLCPALNWPEREVRDLLGLHPDGHPDPRPLVLHPGWTEGFYPLRKPCPETPVSIGGECPGEALKEVSFNPQPLSFTEAEGEGTFEIPVGPVHAGIIEPGHFRFQTIGETVLHLDAQLFYTHKGIEKLLEGKDLEEGLKIVERVCGVCAVSHALAYCEAVEKLKGMEVPRWILGWRTVLAELERLYNHVGDIGNLCAGVGFALGNGNALQNKEQLQRLNHQLFGHRFLRGNITPGGVKKIPQREERAYLQRRLAELEQDFEEWLPLILEHDGFRQRAITTGVLSKQSALDLGVTGPAARASGISQDWRERHAHLLYEELKVEPQVEQEGDVWSRLMVRVREVKQSFALLAELLEGDFLQDTVEQGGSALNGSEPFSPQPYSFAWGCAESPRGTDVIWLMLDDEGKIYRCRIRSASYANWAAVPLAVQGNIVPDFPLINKSFELCYSCCDR